MCIRDSDLPVQPDDVDEPVYDLAGPGTRKRDPVASAQRALIRRDDPRPPAAQLVEPVVVAETNMPQPRSIRVAPLVAQASHRVRECGIVRHDHAALPGRDLL